MSEVAVEAGSQEEHGGLSRSGQDHIGPRRMAGLGMRRCPVLWPPTTRPKADAGMMMYVVAVNNLGWRHATTAVWCDGVTRTWSMRTNPVGVGTW
jgi:hypothetical protein